MPEEASWIYGNCPRKIETDNERWVAIGGKMAFLVSGGGGIRVQPDNACRLMFLNEAPLPGSIASIIIMPGFPGSRFKELAFSAGRLETGHPGVAAVLVDDLIVATNFTSNPENVTIHLPGGTQQVGINTYNSRVVRAARLDQP